MSERAIAVRVLAEVTFGLRQDVLGRQPTPGEISAKDRESDDGHFAVYDDGWVVATGVVMKRAAPLGLTTGGAWHLLGMAVDQRFRRRGLGSAVLAAALGHVADHGGGLVWCHARAHAMDLYRRHGFVEGQHRIEDPVGGTQVFMTNRIEPAGH